MKNKAIHFLALLCTALSVVLIAVSLRSPSSVSFPLHSMDVETLNGGWTLSINGENKGPFTLPGYTGARAGDVVSIEQAMPERDLTRVYLCIRTSQQYVKAYIDDVLVYTYGDRESIPYGSSPGSAWNLVELSQGGETIRFEFSCDYNNRASSLGSMMIGTRYDLFYDLVRIHCVPVFISALTLFCGLCLTLVGVGLIYTRRIGSLFHLGLFCITASVWCLMESNALDLLFPYPFFVTQLGYLSLMLCPIPMLLFLRNFFELRGNKLCDALIIGGCTIFSAAVLLQLFSVLDLFVAVYAGYFAIIVYAVYFFAVLVQKQNQLDRINGVLFRSAVAAIAVFTVADLVTYLLFLRELVTDTQDLAYYFRIGFLLFILMLAAVCIRQIFVGYRRGVEADVLKRMLETDLMTGLLSRHTFDSDMETLRQSPPGERLAMIMFDLNNLKKINDSLGHRKGDDLIRATAALIRETFSSHGSCYRIGGDEFIAILPEIDNALLEQRLADFDAAALLRSKSGDVTIDTAVGYGFFIQERDADISSLFTRVDDAMYRNKSLKKEPGSRCGPTRTTGRRSTDLQELPTRQNEENESGE